MNFKTEYSMIKNEIISLRRYIHQNPELGFNEYNTSRKICEVLDKYEISYTDGIAKTGILAQIGTKSDKVLLIRADMDALAINEKTNLEYASVNEGIMHACGHDIHIASALAAAILLKKYESALEGTVKIVFQPAEETTGGALPMINEGIMDNPRVTCAIGGHVAPDIPVGEIRINKGPLMASPDDFMIKFIGKSTHGAQPENGKSPIIPAAEMVCKTNELAKRLSGGGSNVLSVCSILADGGVNTIPDEAIIYGTFRSFDEKSRTNADELLKAAAGEIAEKHGVMVKVIYNYLYPPVINDEKITEFLIEAASACIGRDNIHQFAKPLMTGEDFSYYGRYAPSAFFWYGGMEDSPMVLHSSTFNASEKAIETASEVFFEFAVKYLEGKYDNN